MRRSSTLCLLTSRSEGLTQHRRRHGLAYTLRRVSVLSEPDERSLARSSHTTTSIVLIGLRLPSTLTHSHRNLHHLTAPRRRTGTPGSSLPHRPARRIRFARDRATPLTDIYSARPAMTTALSTVGTRMRRVPELFYFYSMAIPFQWPSSWRAIGGGRAVVYSNFVFMNRVYLLVCILSNLRC
ncbi:hypothetical protein IW262DRAFT_1370503 [Armillaria fumosa]|nr:hypothetical protein IW262DRAFT_1370503 [Armillaria fumosa]